MRSGQYSPLDQTIDSMAGRILEPFDFTDDEINDIVKEWCSYDFEIGQVVRCLTKLQRIVFERVLKRNKLWDEYKHQFKNRPKNDGVALPVQE